MFAWNKGPDAMEYQYDPSVDYRAMLEAIIAPASTDEERERELRLTFKLDEGGRVASRGGAKGVWRHYERQILAATNPVPAPAETLDAQLAISTYARNMISDRVLINLIRVPIIVDQTFQVITGAILLKGLRRHRRAFVETLQIGDLPPDTTGMVLRAYCALYADARIGSPEVEADLGPLYVASALRHGSDVLPEIQQRPAPRQGPTLGQLTRWSDYQRCRERDRAVDEEGAP
jgi:hypothetical protein